MNIKKSSFSRVENRIGRLNRGRQRVRRQVGLNAGGNNFSVNFNCLKLRKNWPKVVERDHQGRDRDVFLRRGWNKSLFK